MTPISTLLVTAFVTPTPTNHLLDDIKTGAEAFQAIGIGFGAFFTAI